MPTGLLTTWQPENARAGLHLLGHRRTVVLRWACRLAVPAHLAGMNELALSQLDELAELHCGPQAPVDWLGAAATHDVGVLAEQLAAGAYGRAIGFDHRPARLAGLLETVLGGS
ncbi:hypothetical protein [Streptomyces sp. NBC_00158]|uniref:hypothetical protein n=1 Tax=Streptomyces sp. NBC_00158 TaxID=2903627 RepID=UPI002F9094FB